MAFKLYPRCAPYRGEPDRARETRMLQYLKRTVTVPGVNLRSSSFVERRLGPDLIEPDVVVVYDLLPVEASHDRHRLVATAVQLALSAVDLAVIEMVLTATAVPPGVSALAGLVAGGLTGAAAARVGDARDPVRASALVGPVLGALWGGAMGAGIASDPITIGLWRTDVEDALVLLPATALYPGLPDFGARETPS